MLTLLARILLFLSSYSPLFLILGIRSWASNGVAGGLFMGLAVLSAVSAWALLVAVDTLTPTRTPVLTSTSKSSETTGYLVTYVLPFLSVGATAASVPDLLALIVLLLTFGLVFVNSDLVLVNPVLAILGYRLFEVEAEGGQRSLIITRSQNAPQAGSSLQVRRLGPGIGKVVE
jgi:hypothetical protein